MFRSTHTAEEIRDELNRQARRLSLDSEGTKIEFFLPTPTEDDVGPDDPNWDVQAACPEGLDELARRAVENVAEHWDLAEG